MDPTREDLKLLPCKVVFKIHYSIKYVIVYSVQTVFSKLEKKSFKLHLNKMSTKMYALPFSFSPFVSNDNSKPGEL